jgi:hypothetical protein
MRRKRIGWKATRLLAALCLLWGTVSPASGEEKLTVYQHLAKVRQDWIAAGRPDMNAKAVESPEFGTDSMTAIEVQAYAFQPGTSTDEVVDDGNGYRYFSASVNPYMAAAVQVPTGVVIDFLKFSACHVNGGDFVLGLYDNGNAGVPNVPIATLTPGHFDGPCFNASFGPINYTYSQSAHHPLYFVLYWANNPGDGTVKFNNAQIYYHRIVSPAPAAASFTDVPTGHPFFQFIEALKASGITGGCGNGTAYCPDSPLTRGQMAVFLAKSLGLHWPN